MLSAALMNAGPIIHTPLILMNAGPLEHYERWDIHNEGTQPSIRRDRCAGQRAHRAARGPGLQASTYFRLRDHYATDQWMYGSAHDKLTESGDWREHIDFTSHRYMREDVEYGLAFLVSVAQWAGVPSPVAAGLLAIGSAVLGKDLRSESPRTLEALGLAQFDRAAMGRLLAQGHAA
jgi:opine dehydrogenase